MVEKGDIEVASTVQGYHPGRFPQSCDDRSRSGR